MKKREPYLNRIAKSMWNGEVKVITCIRRCGKSVLLFDLFFDYADRRIYIQSALRIDTEEKGNAELQSLLLTKDFFKKIVIRQDTPHSYYDDNGIFHVNIIDFLLGRIELF